MQGEIHHYMPTSMALDEFGDPMLGFYYRFVDRAGRPLSQMMGPYGSGKEAEDACQRAYKAHEY